MNIKPEDITLDTLRHLSKDSFVMWCLTSGAQVDSNEIDFNSHRYLLPIYMDNGQHIVWQKAAQLGATVYMLLRALWWLEAHQGRKAGLYFPTKEGVENLSKDRLTPLIESCPSIRNITAEGDKLGLRKIGKSSFYLYHLGGVASKDSVPLDYLSFDEVRLCDPKDIDQALHRVSHSPYKYKVFMSTCGLPDTDVNARFLRGSQHVWMSRCFTGDQEIWVRHKETKATTLKSFSQLKDCWQDYQAASLLTQRKKLVFRDITHFHDNGVQKVASLKFKDGTTVRCTPNHEFAWASTKKLTTVSYVEAADILTGYRNGRYNRNNLVRASRISDRHAQQAPYDNLTLQALGAYLAEGSFKVERVINIAQLKDKHLWHLMIRWAKENNFSYRATDTGVDVSLITRPDLLTLFMAAGKRCENKVLPDCLRTLSSDQARYVLDGYLSGDGCRDMQDKHKYHIEPQLDCNWECTTTSYDLAKDVQFLSLKAGYPTSIRQNVKQEGKKQTWSVSHNVNSRSIQEQISEDFHTTYLAKMEECLIEERVYDITVDADEYRDHNYILANGLVVHNCGCPDGCDLARTFPDCVISDDPKRPKEVYLRCPKCKWEIKDPQNGRYVPLNSSADFNSYHVSQLVSKFRTPKEILEEYNHTTNMEEFFNAALGIPYIDGANRGVTPSQLEACINPELRWMKDELHKGAHTLPRTAMGVDQGGAYNVVVIADINPDGTKKRIRHIEIIEQHNPEYYRDGKQTSPFDRLHELMDEFNVGLAVVDLMPNYNDALKFAQAFPRRVFLAHYQQMGNEVVQWADRSKSKPSTKKAGPLLNFKYQCTLGRYPSLSFALGEWAEGNVEIPPLDGIRQMARSEEADFRNQLKPESPARRLFNHLPRLIKRWKEADPEAGTGRWEWIYAGGDPHLAHAWNYCNVGLERLRRSTIFTFA